jgi:hypothetical protein
VHRNTPPLGRRGRTLGRVRPGHSLGPDDRGKTRSRSSWPARPSSSRALPDGEPHHPTAGSSSAPAGIAAGSLDHSPRLRRASGPSTGPRQVRRAIGPCRGRAANFQQDNSQCDPPHHLVVDLDPVRRAFALAAWRARLRATPIRHGIHPCSTRTVVRCRHASQNTCEVNSSASCGPSWEHRQANTRGRMRHVHGRGVVLSLAHQSRPPPAQATYPVMDSRPRTLQPDTYQSATGWVRRAHRPPRHSGRSDATQFAHGDDLGGPMTQLLRI